MKSLCFRALFLCLGVASVLSGCGGGASSGGGGGKPPVPTVSSISPTSAPAGSGDINLAVNGTGFLSSTVINVGGKAETTTYVSSTQVTAKVPAAQLASGAELNVVAVNGSQTSGSGAAIKFEVTNPVPAITSLSPSAETLGAASLALAVTGTGFISTTVINVNGSPRPTSFSSATLVNVTLTAADVSAAGSLSLIASNLTPGGGMSSAVTLAVNDPPVGTIQLSPSALAAGGTSPATITVTGSTFIPTSVVQVNGGPRPTTYVSSSTLTFVATVADQAATAALSVTVTNPAPGGGTSPVAKLIIGSPTPTPFISSVSPNPIDVGSPDTPINVVGSGFTADSSVQWNGTALTVSGFVSSTFGATLIATVPAADLAGPGTATVTVSTPTANPSLSNAITVNITQAPAPTLASITPSLSPINTATPITLSGTGFTSRSKIAINGVALATAYAGSTSLSTTLPASSIATPGVYNITVSTPSPGGGTSAAANFTAYVQIPNYSMVFNPVNGLFYLSVPSSAGAPYGNSVVSIDPLTGVMGTPIPVGSEPDQLAITADGRYLWVALDGASAVRKIDLSTGTAGLQFSTVPEAYGFAAAVLAAVPGQTDSVVVSNVAGNAGQALAIYDSGVIRGNPIQATFFTYNPWGLVVDGTRSEIYAAGSGSLGPANYNTYTYDSSGLKLKASSNTNLLYADQNNNEIQIFNGRLYTDFGQVDDPESGALLGSFYTSGTTLAQGSTAVDPALGLAFVLEGGWSSDQFQVEAFNLSDFTKTAATPLQVANPTARADYMIQGPTGNRFTRWGSDGLAYRTTGGFISFRTSMVRVLSSTNADLQVTLAASGANTTGSVTTYTATVTNGGPAPASSVDLIASLPSTGVLNAISPFILNASPSAGICSTTGPIICNLGTLSNGSMATVVFTVLQTSAGNAATSVQVNASENDPVPSNNRATSSLTITGSEFNLAPTLTAISPQAIISGSSDTAITVTGTNFTSGSTVLLNGNALATTFTSSTELTATVPAVNLANIGWASVAVSSPAPGGGTSSALPLTVFSVITLGTNHILYDPYSRNIMASVSSGSASVASNSIVAIKPDTATVGTPITLAGTPTVLALSTDGQILYTLVPDTTTGTVARVNMLTQKLDFSVSGFQADGYNTGLRDLAAMPGAENTVAVDEGEYPGNSIFDFDPIAKTATRRGTATGTYTGTCLAFPNATSMFSLDLYTSPSEIQLYQVTANGLANGTYPYSVGSVIQNQGCYKLDGGLLFTIAGGVASTATSPLTQSGAFEGLVNVSSYAGVKDFEPDTSLNRAFYLTDATPNNYSAIFDSITAFSTQTFMPVSSLTLPFQDIEGTTGVTGVDVVRWGRDGLAVLSSGGHIYLVRGPFVVPQLMNQNSAAIVTSSSTTTITHGTGNTLLTLTGSNFLPGVAVTWNGSYRTTTIVDSTHITVAIPATDLASAGTGSLVATNAGATASNTLIITIN